MPRRRGNCAVIVVIFLFAALNVAMIALFRRLGIGANEDARFFLALKISVGLVVIAVIALFIWAMNLPGPGEEGGYSESDMSDKKALYDRDGKIVGYMDRD